MIKDNMNTDGHNKTVSASDVEKYGYCPLSWWLSEQSAKEDREKLRKGTVDHALIGKDVKKIERKEKLTKESERSILWFSLIAIVIGINGIAIIYPIYAPSYQGKAIMVLLSVIAVLWVVVAVLFFYTGIKMEIAVKRRMDDSASNHTSIKKIEAHTSSEPQTVWKRRFYEAKWSMLLFFLISGTLAMHGLIILFRLGEVHSQLLSQVFLFFSLIWLVGSSFFYYISLKRELKTQRTDKIRDIEGEKRSFTDSEISVGLFAVVATILASNSLTIYQNPQTDIGRIILIVAILWLYGGFIFLYRAFRANLKAKLFVDKELKERIGIRVKKKIITKTDLKYRIEMGTLDYERGVIWFAAIAMILALNAIIMNFSDSLEKLYGTLIAHIFEVVALIWLLGALFFLYMVLRYSRMVTRLKYEHGIEDGTIEYVDTLDEDSKVLFSEKYGLRGRPDYILNKGGKLVPVEVKTGRVPRGPLFSHILQLAAYCLLIEEKYNRPPPYGMIRYNDIQHKIEYTEELRNILISKLDEMRKINESGEAHRNHNRPSKCKGCSRKKMCPERLT